MPELPEIETVKLQLGKALTGATIKSVQVISPKSFMGKAASAKNKKIVAVRRMAKVLLMDIEGEVTLAFHFKMTGQLIYVGKNIRIVGGHPTADFTGKLPSPHTRVIINLNKGTLFFNDQRRFGWVKVGTKEEISRMKFLQNLGPEPISMTVNQVNKVIKLIKLKKSPIKVVIMDQEIISGVGNIYANDALWEAGIRPDTGCAMLSIPQFKLLFEKLKLVLKEGIKYGGATAADAKYLDLHGAGGHYQDHFRTYDRKGEKCLRCDGGIIKKITLGGRGTYYCPVCQK
jgi:formamidopyrimidine-DNA glycosylase